MALQNKGHVDADHASKVLVLVNGLKPIHTVKQVSKMQEHYDFVFSKLQIYKKLL